MNLNRFRESDSSHHSDTELYCHSDKDLSRCWDMGLSCYLDMDSFHRMGAKRICAVEVCLSCYLDMDSFHHSDLYCHLDIDLSRCLDMGSLRRSDTDSSRCSDM